jgi:hypothetical protein
MTVPILDVEETNENGTTPGRRLAARLVSVTLQLEVVADDGETLHPIETKPIRIPAGDWPNFRTDVALAQIQEQLR